MTKKSNRSRRNGISGRADPQTERLLGEHWFSSADRGTVEQEVKTAIYVRYSPRPDEKEASVERQIEMCKAYLERIGAPQPTQDRIFVDRMLSGTHSHRPAYQALLRDLAAGGHTMAVAEFSDRLTRDLGELGRVHKLYEHYGAKLHFAMQGTLPPAMIALHGFLSMEQRSQLILRTTEGRRRAASAGRSVGKRPYGYRAVPGSRGVLVVEQGEAAIVRRIFTEYVRGASIRSIVVRLNGEGLPSPAGKMWTQQTVSGRSGLLRRSLYAGWWVFGSTRWRRNPFTNRMAVQDVPVGERILTSMPALAIVDEATWTAAQSRLEDATKKVAKPASAGGRLLTGHIYCPCGSRMQYGGTRERPRLICTAYLQMGTCDRKRTIAAAVIEGDVLRLIRDGVDPEARQASESASKPKNGPRLHRSRRNELRRRMGSIDAELASCVSAETEGMSGERLAAKRERLEAEVARIGAEIQRLEAQASNTPSHHDESLGIADAFATMLVRTPLDIRTTADRAMANVFRRIAGKIEIDLSQEDRSYRIRIALADPPVNMARGHILERTYDRPRFGFLKDPDLVKRAYAAADRELFALADEDWNIVAHLFAGYAWRSLEPRRALDALLFHAWTGVPIARTPPRFGGVSTLRGAGILLVRSGNWKRVLTLLTAAESPVVEGIDTGYFDSWMTGRKP